MDVIKKSPLLIGFLSSLALGQARVKFSDGTLFTPSSVSNASCGIRAVQKDPKGKAQIPKVAFPFAKGEKVQVLPLAGKSFIGKKFPSSSSVVLVYSPITKKYYLSSATCFGATNPMPVRVAQKPRQERQPSPSDSSEPDSGSKFYFLLGGTSFMDKLKVTQGSETVAFNVSSILAQLAGSYQVRVGSGSQLIFDGSILGGLTEVGPSSTQTSSLVYEVQNLPTYMLGLRPAFVWDIAKNGGYAGIGLPIYMRYQRWPSQEEDSAEVVTTESNMKYHYGLSGVMALDLDPVLISCEGAFMLRPKTYVWTFALGYKM